MTAEAESALERMRLPRTIAESRLVRNGGISVVRGLFSPGLLASLVSEAQATAPSARRSIFSGPNREDWRGGEPSRAMAGMSAGPIQYEICSSPAMAEAISEICGVRVRCSGAGSYSWYLEAGDHLALHRDIIACDVAIITCLERTGPAAGSGGTLCVYPEDRWRPLRDVRQEAHVAVPMEAGDTAVLAGGIVPHEVTPSVQGQRRVVSIVCFRLASA